MCALKISCPVLQVHYLCSDIVIKLMSLFVSCITNFFAHAEVIELILESCCNLQVPIYCVPEHNRLTTYEASLCWDILWQLLCWKGTSSTTNSYAEWEHVFHKMYTAKRNCLCGLQSAEFIYIVINDDCFLKPTLLIFVMCCRPMKVESFCFLLDFRFTCFIPHFITAYYVLFL